MRLGIDFGTTRTVVARADRGNYPVIGFVDAAGDRAAWIPTLVAERAGELRFGFEAAAVLDDPTFTILRSFKRLLSGPDAGPQQRLSVGTTELRAADLIVKFLAYVRDAILTRSDARLGGGKEAKTSAGGALQAAIAVPANAPTSQRFVTLDAFRRAGFEVKAMLNEPSAAGFEYTHRHRDTLSSRRDIVVVYDLGGGTFDASMVRMSGRRHEVLATAGVGRLGGDDFDRVLADLVLSRLGFPDGALAPSAWGHLVDQCRAAKEALHASSRKITVDLEAALGGAAPQPEITIATSDYYDACAPLVTRTVEVLTPIMSRIDSCVDGETAAPDLTEVAGIYVVGGASELPLVARALRQQFGRRVHRSPYPSAAVAIGLAIAADTGAGLELVDRYSRTFGVFREGAGGRDITFDAIFQAGTELPSASSEPLVSTRRYRAAHNVGHFRFFDCERFDENGGPRGDMAFYGDLYFPFDTALREADLPSVPVSRRTVEGPEIVEEYSLDQSGIVGVLIRNLDSGDERCYRFADASPAGPPGRRTRR
ncbi:MAG: Hsp70 family protein [Myxococcota bacterium]|nr:Hsp70 family protein [Myxococcota bacterium]